VAAGPARASRVPPYPVGTRLTLRGWHEGHRGRPVCVTRGSATHTGWSGSTLVQGHRQATEVAATRRVWA